MNNCLYVLLVSFVHLLLGDLCCSVALYMLRGCMFSFLVFSDRRIFKWIIVKALHCSCVTLAMFCHRAAFQMLRCGMCSFFFGFQYPLDFEMFNYQRVSSSPLFLCFFCDPLSVCCIPFVALLYVFSALVFSNRRILKCITVNGSLRLFCSSTSQ